MNNPIWLCKEDQKNQEQLYGKVFEIKTIPNVSNDPCVRCGKRADFLVSGIPTLFGKPVFLTEALSIKIDIVFGNYK